LTDFHRFKDGLLGCGWMVIHIIKLLHIVHVAQDTFSSQSG